MDGDEEESGSESGSSGSESGSESGNSSSSRSSGGARPQQQAPGKAASLALGGPPPGADEVERLTHELAALEFAKSEAVGSLQRAAEVQRLEASDAEAELRGKLERTQEEGGGYRAERDTLRAELRDMKRAQAKEGKEAAERAWEIKCTQEQSAELVEDVETRLRETQRKPDIRPDIVALHIFRR